MHSTISVLKEIQKKWKINKSQSLGPQHLVGKTETCENRNNARQSVIKSKRAAENKVLQAPRGVKRRQSEKSSKRTRIWSGSGRPNSNGGIAHETLSHSWASATGDVKSLTQTEVLCCHVEDRWDGWDVARLWGTFGCQLLGSSPGHHPGS